MRKLSFTVVEVILAMGLFALIVVGGAGAAARAFSTNRLGEEETYANFLASGGIEATRVIAARDYYGLVNGSYGLGYQTGEWLFSGSYNDFGKFRRTITISNVNRDANGNIVESGGHIDLFTKRVVAKVEWDFSPLRHNESILTTYLTHWEESLCDWSGAAIADTLNLSGSADATSIVVDGNYAYVGKRDNSSNPEFFVLNIADPTNISVVGTGQLNLYGINGLTKKGNYVYAATRDLIEMFNIATEVTIFNVSNPAAPVRTFASVPGTHEATGVAIAGNNLYVVTNASSSYPEFFIMSLTNPANPVYRGDVEIGANVNGITVRGNYAFLATSIPNKELMVFNVSNPDNPVEIGSYDVPGVSAIGQSADYTGSVIHFVTRDAGGGNPEYYLLDSTNPAAITLIGSFDVSSRTNWVDAATGFSLLATEKANEEFKIINTSNPAALSSLYSLDLNGVAYSVGRKVCSAFVVGANDTQEVTVVTGEEQ